MNNPLLWQLWEAHLLRLSRWSRQKPSDQRLSSAICHPYHWNPCHTSSRTTNRAPRRANLLQMAEIRTTYLCPGKHYLHTLEEANLHHRNLLRHHETVALAKALELLQPPRHPSRTPEALRLQESSFRYYFAWLSQRAKLGCCIIPTCNSIDKMRLWPIEVGVRKRAPKTADFTFHLCYNLPITGRADGILG